jgi:hypothetical protein
MFAVFSFLSLNVCTMRTEFGICSLVHLLLYENDRASRERSHLSASEFVVGFSDFFFFFFFFFFLFEFFELF